MVVVVLPFDADSALAYLKAGQVVSTQAYCGLTVKLHGYQQKSDGRLELFGFDRFGLLVFLNADGVVRRPKPRSSQSR